MSIQCGFLKQHSYMFWICGVTYISKPVTQDFLSHIQSVLKGQATLSHPVQVVHAVVHDNM